MKVENITLEKKYHDAVEHWRRHWFKDYDLLLANRQKYFPTDEPFCLCAKLELGTSDTVAVGDHQGEKKRVAPDQLTEEEARHLLARIPVEPQFIVALWGIESDFGQIAGTFPVIDARATLAYASSRVEFYQKELFHALRILDKGHVPPDRMKGSWAGAMGQVQFMPSSFQAVAADYDEDEKVDTGTTSAMPYFPRLIIFRVPVGMPVKVGALRSRFQRNSIHPRLAAKSQ